MEAVNVFFASAGRACIRHRVQRKGQVRRRLEATLRLLLQAMLNDAPQPPAPADHDPIEPEEDVEDLDEAEEVIPYRYSISAYGTDYLIVPKFSWDRPKRPRARQAT